MSDFCFRAKFTCREERARETRGGWKRKREQGSSWCVWWGCFVLWIKDQRVHGNKKLRKWNYYAIITDRKIQNMFIVFHVGYIASETQMKSKNNNTEWKGVITSCYWTHCFQCSDLVIRVKDCIIFWGIILGWTIQKYRKGKNVFIMTVLQQDAHCQSFICRIQRQLQR